MRQLQSLFTWLALLAAVAVSAAAAVHVTRQGLPEPNPAEALVARGDLVRYLSTADLSQESRGTTVRLIDRLENEFRQGRDWQGDLTPLDDAAWERFQANFAHVMEVWFLDKVDRFHQLPVDARNRFLDREINNILRWRVVTSERSGQAPPRPAPERRRGRGRGPGGNRDLGAIIGVISRIAEQASDAERRRCEEFLAALQLRFMNRALERLPGA